MVDGFVLPLGRAEGTRILIERLPKNAPALSFYRIVMRSASPDLAAWTTALATGLNELGREPWPASVLPDLARTIAGSMSPGLVLPSCGGAGAADDPHSAERRRLFTLLWPDEATGAFRPGA